MSDPTIEKGATPVIDQPQSEIGKIGEVHDVSSAKEQSLGYGKIDDIIIDTVNAETEYTSEQFRKIRWKIDLWLLPLMWVSCCLSTSITPIL